MKQAVFEQPVTKSNWTVRPHNRDTVHLFDGRGRRVAIVYRVGDANAAEGGSPPMDVAQVILDAVNADREEMPTESGVSDAVVTLRRECDRLGIAWHHNHKEGRLKQLIESRQVGVER